MNTFADALKTLLNTIFVSFIGGFFFFCGFAAAAIVAGSIVIHKFAPDIIKFLSSIS